MFCYLELLKGSELDEIALKLGLIRRTKWWLFKESDRSLRDRLCSRVCEITDRKLSVLGVKVLR